MAAKAFARVLVKRLNDHQFSLSERLLISKKVLVKGRLPLFSGTETVVIDWIVNQIDTFGTSQKSERHVRKLWKTLCHALGAIDEGGCGTVQWQNLSWTNLIKVLTKGMLHYPPEGSPLDLRLKIVKCCKLFVTNCAMRKHVLSDLKEAISLLACVLESMEHNSDSSIAEGLQNITNELVEHCTALHWSQNNDPQVFQKTLQHLVKPFSLLLLRVDSEPEHLPMELLQKIIDLMKILLFKRFLEDVIIKLDLTLCDESLLRDRSNPFLLLMFKPQKIEDEESELIQKPCRALIPFVLENSFAMFRKLTDCHKFKLFLSAVRILGFDHRLQQMKLIGTNQNFVDNEETWSTLNVLLKSVSRFPSVMRCFSLTEEINAPKWFGMLMESLLVGNFNRCVSWYGCLDTLMNIDVSLITSRITLLLKKTLVIASQDIDDLAEVARCDFLCSLLDTYSRLSQISSLVSKITSVLNNGTTNFDIVGIPHAFFRRYGELCIRLPPISTMEIINCLKELISLLRPSQLEGSNSKWFHILVDLLRHTIVNAQLVGVAMPKVVLDSLVDTSQSLMIDCIEPLIRLTLKLSSLLAKCLLLSHAWSELHLVLLQYQPIYSGTLADRGIQPHFAWEEDVLAECEASNNVALKYAFAVLTVQKLKFSLLAEESLELPKRLKFVASQLVTHLQAGASGSWDGHVGNLQDDNIAIAFFQLINDNFQIIVPHMSSEDSDTLVRVMVSNFDKMITCGSNLISSVTLAKVATNLFQSSHIQESIVFLTAIVTNVAKKFEDALPPKSKNMNEQMKNLHCCLTHLSKQSSSWLEFAYTNPDNTDLNKMWTCIKKAGSAMTSSLAGSEPLSMTSDELELIISEIDGCLDLLVNLPLEYLLMGNQTRCLMLTFTMLNVILRCPELDDRVMEVLAKGQFVIHSLFDGLRSVWFLNFVQPKNFLLWIYSATMKIANNLVLDLTVAKYEKHQETCQGFFSLILQQCTKDHDSCMEIGPFITEVDWQVIPFRESSGDAITLASSLMIILLEAMKRSPQLVDHCTEYLTAMAENVIQWLSSYFDQYDSTVGVDASTTASVAALLYCFGLVLHFYSKDEIKIEDKSKIIFNDALSKILPPAISLVVASRDTVKDDAPRSEHLYFICELLIQRNELKQLVPQDLIMEAWLRFIKSVQITSLSRHERRRFKKLFITCSGSEFSAFMDQLIEQLKIGDLTVSSGRSVRSAVRGLTMLLQQKFCENVKNLEGRDTEIFRCSHLILHQLSELSGDQSQLDIGVDLLQLNNILMKHLPHNPAYVSLSLSSCVLVDLTKVRNDDTFLALFGATHELLNTLLMSRLTILVNMIPAFMCAIQQLTHSLVKRGQSHLLKDALPEYRAALLDCAEKNLRMFSQIAKCEERDFISFAVYMIADFVCYSTEAILSDDIKKRLDEGIFELMSLQTGVGNDSLLACLKSTPLEKFKILHEEFMKYYRYKGNV